MTGCFNSTYFIIYHDCYTTPFELTAAAFIPWYWLLCIGGGASAKNDPTGNVAMESMATKTLQ